MNDKFKEAFKEESSEILSILEEGLLELENRPEDDDLIAKIFRALHTIKGSSGMFGFDVITLLTHDIETVFDRIRCKKYTVSKEIIENTLKACDLIKKILDSESNESFAGESSYTEVLDTFRKIAGISEHKDTHPIKTINCSDEKLTAYNVIFKPSRNIFASGTNPLLLINELMTLGTGSVRLHADNIPQLKDINPEECYFWWDINLSTNKSSDEIKDVFIFVESESELIIQETLTPVHGEECSCTPDEQKISNVQKSELQSSRNKPEHNDRNNKYKKSQKPAEPETVSSIRVGADKLDKLVNLVGELVTVQARLTQTAEKRKDNELISISEEVERLTWELRDSALNIRMVPIGTMFNKFNRLVRDLSKELGKEVSLVTEGAETELDKSLIERLNDPLIHIIRNSIDHGIEKTEKRDALNKDSKGSIFLSARHSGTNIEIEITDDGAGISKKDILRKAKEQGLISDDSKLSEKEVYDLIFHPGFSTAKTVTNVSGRGVGMDVVKRAIESLRGSIEVSSEENIGTTITLKIPLTLAIIEGLLVSINNDHFIIPLSYVEECIELTGKDIQNSHGRNIIRIRGELIPYIKLREQFHIAGVQSDIQQIVVVNNNKIRTGLVVDKVIGEHQTVIKSLGRFYKYINGISGATILGDGTVALIMDIGKVIKEAEIQEKIEAK